MFSCHFDSRASHTAGLATDLAACGFAGAAGRALRRCDPQRQHLRSPSPMSQPAARSISNSEAAIARAIKVMPGGVSSPVRAFNAVGGTPLFIKHAEGCTITDIDGN